MLREELDQLLRFLLVGRLVVFEVLVEVVELVRVHLLELAGQVQLGGCVDRDSTLPSSLVVTPVVDRCRFGCFGRDPGLDHLASSSKSKHQLQLGLVRDVVVAEGAAVLELQVVEAQSLLVLRDALKMLDEGLDSGDRVRSLDIQCDDLALGGLHEDLHVGVALGVALVVVVGVALVVIWRVVVALVAHVLALVGVLALVHVLEPPELDLRCCRVDL